MQYLTIVYAVSYCHICMQDRKLTALGIRQVRNSDWCVCMQEYKLIAFNVGPYEEDAYHIALENEYLVEESKDIWRQVSTTVVGAHAPYDQRLAGNSMKIRRQVSNSRETGCK